MSDHEWCRDVRRDEAIRAAEDAAAVPSIQHRDLPEQVALLWASVGDLIGRVVRLEGEIDAGQDEEAAPAEGMRKERGESVRVVEEPAEIALLTAERDLARAVRDGLRSQRDAARAECERLSEWVPLRASMEVARLKARVAELEAAAPPRGWLTAEERETLKNAADAAESWWGSPAPSAKVIKSLLARSTPPRVKVPHLDDLEADERPVWVSACHAWVAAIREAGGEVE